MRCLGFCQICRSELRYRVDKCVVTDASEGFAAAILRVQTAQKARRNMKMQETSNILPNANNYCSVNKALYSVRPISNYVIV